MKPRTAIIILISAAVIVSGVLYLLYRFQTHKNKPNIIETNNVKDDNLTIEEKRQNLDKAQEWLDAHKNNLTIEEKRQNLDKALNDLNK